MWQVVARTPSYKTLPAPVILVWYSQRQEEGLLQHTNFAFPSLTGRNSDQSDLHSGHKSWASLYRAITYGCTNFTFWPQTVVISFCYQLTSAFPLNLHQQNVNSNSRHQTCRRWLSVKLKKILPLQKLGADASLGFDTLQPCKVTFANFKNIINGL